MSQTLEDFKRTAKLALMDGISVDSRLTLCLKLLLHLLDAVESLGQQQQYALATLAKHEGDQKPWDKWRTKERLEQRLRALFPPGTGLQPAHLTPVASRVVNSWLLPYNTTQADAYIKVDAFDPWSFDWESIRLGPAAGPKILAAVQQHNEQGPGVAPRPERTT